MNHDELRALVPAYAAGELAGPDAESLRAHLATGCAECLEDMFRRPVGLPREVPATRRTFARRVPSLALGAALCAGVLALVAVRAVADLRRRQVALREDSDRRALLAADERAALEARVRRLESEVDGARAEASAQAEAARSVRAENARLEAALHEAEALAQAAPPSAPPVRRPSMVARKPVRAAEAPPVPAPLLGRLEAVPPFREPHGHVLWNPDRGELQLYAIDLPRLPTGADYRLRYRLDDGRLETGPLLQPAADGAVSRVITVAADGTALREVEIILEPSARTVVSGRIDAVP